MLRVGKLARLGAGLGGLAVCLTALAPGVARADSGPLSFAGMLVPPKTFPAQYSCDLSAYGSGISPVTLSATVTVPGRAETLVPVPITLKTTSVALPPSVLSKLSGVVSFDLTATLAATEAQLPTPVPLSGQNPVSGTLTGLPAATAQTSDTNPLVFFRPGTAKIQVPARTLTFTPHTSATALPAITCTTTVTRRDILVTVTLGVLGRTGPLYKCVVTVDIQAIRIDIEEFLVHVPMTVTVSGKRTTGNTVTVRLVAGVGGPFPPGVTAVRFSADLPVLGAQPGRIALSEPITDLASAVTRASGKLRLTKAGTDRILIPDKFTVTFNVSSSGIQVPFAFTFTIRTSPVPVGVTLKVARGHAGPHPSPTPTGSGGQPQGSGTPSGAPNTGGGTGPGGDMAVAAGGLAILLSGGGLLILARRRRRTSW